MTNLFITDQDTIFDYLNSKNFLCILLTTSFDVRFNSAGKVIKSIDVKGVNFDICLNITNNKNIEQINYEIEKLESVCLINVTVPQEKSQFNFDMMLSQINDKDKIVDVKRIWINDISQLNSLNINDSKLLLDNADFKNISQYYLVKSLVNDYWSHSRITSVSNIVLTLQDYYIISLILKQEDEISKSEQTTFFTVSASYQNIEGKLLKHKKSKFKTFDEANSINSQLSTFMVIKSKYKETNVSKPLLFTISSLVKASSKIENIENIIQSLYQQGFITNPYTNNHTLPTDIIPLLIKNMEEFGNRYNHIISHIESYGISLESRKRHIENNYSNDYYYSIDKTHAILPLPGNPNILSEHELYVYDLIVLRYFTMFMPNSIRYTKQVEAVSSENITLKLEKSGDLLLGCSVFKNTINTIFFESDPIVKSIKSTLPIGSIVNKNDLNLEVKGNVSSIAKELNETQLISKLTNMGKKMIPRKSKLRYRNFSVGDATIWHKHIDYLEKHRIIFRNDDKTFSITQSGKEILKSTKSFILNIDNLNNLHIDLVKVLTNERNVNDVLKDHLSLLKSLENTSNFTQIKAPNYKKIISSNMCKCGHELREFKDFIGCTNYPNCKLSISKVITSKDSYILTELDFVELIKNGLTTSVIEQFEFKSGKKANIVLALNDAGKVNYRFINNKK